MKCENDELKKESEESKGTEEGQIKWKRRRDKICIKLKIY